MDYHAKAARVVVDRPPVWEDDRSCAGPSPSVSSVRLQSDRMGTAKVPNQLPLNGMYRALSPPSVFSMLSQVSDQPPPTCDPPLTPSREPGRPNRNASVAVRLSSQPTEPHRSPGPRPVREARISDLHPDLAAITRRESSLSETGNRVPNQFITRCLLSSSQISAP